MGIRKRGEEGVWVPVPYLKLFFISRSLAITFTGSVWLVAFVISGSCNINHYDTQ